MVDVFLVIVECNHNVEIFTSNNDADCTKDGTKTGVCTICNCSVTEIDIGSKLEHSYSISNVKESNCTDVGFKIFACICGDNYREDVQALGHSFTVINKVDPACLNLGVVNYKCSNCGEYKNETLPATYHTNATTDNGTSATCAQIGFTAGKFCPDCDTWLEGHEVIPTTDHTYTSTVTQEPTCISDGTTIYTCECGDSYTETIPATGHNWTAWEDSPLATCTQDGTKVRYCWDCMSEEKETVPAKGHYYVEEVEYATQEADGKYYSRCANCFAIEEDNDTVIPKIASIKLSTSVCTYNGKVRNPSVIVKDSAGKKLVEGTDFIRVYGGFTAGTTKEKREPGNYTISIKFQGNYKGEKNLIFIIKPKAPTSFSFVAESDKAITLTWKKSVGVAGYRIYQYSSAKKEYVLKGSVKTTSYSVTGLKNGTTYKFKIRPYIKNSLTGKTIWGDYSEAFTVCTRPAKLTIKSLTASSGKATLSWNNVSGENGYQVYYSTSKNGTYKKMESVSANTVKYTTSKLTAGKTYYFKVRAYKKVDGTTVFGDFSDVKSVKNPLVYYVTKTGTKYHVDGCRSLSRSKIQISYSNAIAKGYKPCNSCIK